jgi:UDP-N-acetylglucosamine acyltransferase
MSDIHATAIIDDSVELGANVRIGPYCHVSGAVRLGDNVQLESHVVVTGDTVIGADTHIYSFASIGSAPQDLKFNEDEKTQLIIGQRNKIREHVTMNPGTEGGGGMTKVGDDCLFMVGSHVAHDCHVGNHVIMANNACLAGHVVLGDYAIIGGLAGVHQFCRIGAHAFVGVGGVVVEDVIPYGVATGNRAEVAALNLVGLKRRGFERQQVNDLRAAFKNIFLDTQGSLTARIEATANAYPDAPLVQDLIQFMRAEENRGYSLPSRK